MRTYADFDLRIEKSGRGYRARVRSPAGEGEEEFRFPFVKAELERLLPQIAETRGPARRVDAPALAAAKELGGRLFRAVFAGEIQSRWSASLAQAAASGEGLRLRLRLGSVPKLSELPWELLYDAGLNRFPSLTPETPVVRHLDLGAPARPLAGASPLRVLVVTARARGSPRLEVEEEWKRISEAAAGPGAGRMIVERLASATFEALKQRLQAGTWHVLHFSGHGTFDPELDDGVLVLEGDRGGRDPVSQRLANLVAGHPDLRLVVINACEGGRHSCEDSFSGLAQSLIQKQVPAVLAMQLEISDQAAVRFAGRFYRSLAEGLPVDAAVTEARREIDDEASVEWCAPVLYMRSADGRIFAAADPPAAKGETHAGRRFWGGLLAAVLAGTATWGVWQLGAKDDPLPQPLLSAPPAPSSPRCPSPPGLGMPFVLIPPGGFVMGDEKGEKDEKPPHRVELRHAFCLGRYEVTRREWEIVMGMGLPAAPADDLPVQKVSWQDTQEFFRRLNALEPGAEYRLPTEAEWEYAARAGRQTRFSFGDGEENLFRYGNCLSQEHDDQRDRTATVGSFKPNPWGLYDMHGNVWEWVQDFYGLYRGAPAVDPTGPRSGELRVRRGGAFDSSPENCRSARRKSSKPDYRSGAAGFRVARAAK